jgi:transposase
MFGGRRSGTVGLYGRGVNEVKGGAMGERFVNVDRRTPMLLPPDLREWVADNELAHLVLEAVELCDLRGARVNVRGSGSEQYPPGMMLALLIYAYATGVFSSRRIERATYESVAVRYLCANHHPDHDTIAKFRRENEGLFRSCFAEVLLLAREAGVLQVGAVSVDGTRLAGAGSKGAVRRIEEIERELKELAQELVQKAEAADGQDKDAEGTQLPAELAQREERQRKLLAARETIWARREAARAQGQRDQAGSACRSKTASVSEPESRSLGRKGGGAVQGYNAQAVIDAGKSGLILGAHLSAEPNDSKQLRPALASMALEVGPPCVVLVDQGYDQTQEIARAEAQWPLLVLCPPAHRPNAKPYNPKRRGLAEWKWQQRRQMEERLAHPFWRGLYQRRQPTAEAAFARIKQHLGFRRFRVWGQAAASSEWVLVCLAHNCRMLTSKLNPKS